MKIDWKLRERALTLYSTGKFGSRQEALKEAIEERKRAEAKKNKSKDGDDYSTSWNMKW